MRRLSLPWVVLGLVGAGGCGTAPKDPPASAADAQESEPQGAGPTPALKTLPMQTPDGGFALDVAKAIRPHGATKARTSQRLKATYRWDDGEPQAAMVLDNGDSWRLLFPSTPEPDAIAKLVLKYEFDLDDETKQRLSELAGSLRATVVKAVQTTLDDDTVKGVKPPAAQLAAFNLKFSAEMGQASDELVALKEFRGAEDEAGDALVLAAMGIKTPKPGTYVVDADKLRGVTHLKDGAQSFKEFANASASQVTGAACLPKGLPKPDASEGEVHQAFDACRIAYTTVLKPLVDQANAGAGDLKQLGGDTEQLLAKLNGLEWKPGQAYSDETEEYAATTRAQELHRKVGELVTKLNVTRPAQLDSAYGAIVWATQRQSQIYLEQQLLAELTGEIDRIVVELTQEQSGKVLIKKSAERRYWDVATGAVYVGDLEDVLTPVMIAFCPVGCLRKGEHMFEWSANLGRAWSLDIGTRVGVWDNDTDPRHLDRPSFLVGASVNPFYFFRGSAGMYAFDNAQTGDWNRAWYVGATINLIHAADFLGPLGLSPPTVETKTEAGGDETEDSN